MDLSSLHVFIRVADLQSFSQAAEQLGMAKARVSTTIQQLEAELGTRLLARTTRRVRLTADGELFRTRSLALLAEAEAMGKLFRDEQEPLAGTLRVDLPVRLALQHIIPALGGFLGAHPALHLALSTTDHPVHPIHEGFDCVLRVGPPGTGDWIARPVGSLPLCNVASPAYLAHRGTPSALADLAGHTLVHYAPDLAGPCPGWEYRGPDGVRYQPMPSVLTVNGTDAYEAAALAGLGLIQPPRAGVAAHLAAGRLVEVLPEFTGPALPVSLLHAPGRVLPRRTRVFMDWLEALLATLLAAPPGSPD